MEYIILLAVFLLISFFLSEKKNNSYKNIHAVITAAVSLICSITAVIIIEALGGAVSFSPLLISGAAFLVVIVCKLIVKKLSASDGYFVPYRYLNGIIAKLIDVFYEKKQVSFYLKPKYVFLRNLLFASIAAETVFLAIVVLSSNLIGETLLVCISAALMLFFEAAMFLCGVTQISIEENKYRMLEKCDTTIKYLGSKYSYPDDYEYLFRKNNKTEKPHLLYATMHNYKTNTLGKESIRLYDFEEKKYTYIEDHIQNDVLDEFLKSNGLEINPLYVQVFSLLDRGNNVLMESSSYSDFDPYLAALIKKVSSETYKIVVVVDTENSGSGFINRYQRIFKEYFGAVPIPVIKTFKDVVYYETEKAKKRDKTLTAVDKIFEDIFSEEAESDIGMDYVKSDVVVLTPEDILDSANSDVLRKIVSEIGFIIYYDFSECVHEETLFCKIIHSVLDSDDKISTLYMSDGFFDFKQAINNFFSIRPFYEVIVPRNVPEKSYCTVWKYENAKEMQERSIVNPSVDFGMHHVLSSFGSNYLRNNSMIIADESDIYAETFAEFASTTDVADKTDCFVGWKDVVEGNYVYCSVTDRYNNIPHTYLAIRGVGNIAEYVNIVSKPYLLREYLAYFSKFFSTVPDALTSFSAAMINTSRATALECIIKSFLIGCTAEQIRSYAVKINIDHSLMPEELLAVILEETRFDCNADLLEVTCSDERYFINKEVYDLIIGKTEFVTKIHFMVNNQEIVRYKKDYNYLVPRQKLALEGRKYTVLDINDSYVELSDSQAREAVYSTRLVRSCRAKSSVVKNTFSYVSNNNRASMYMSNIICNLDVKIHGRIAFKDDYSFDESRRMNNYMYTAASSVFERSYRDANVLRVKLKFPGDINDSNNASMAHTLALLINEMLPTFFPKHSDRIIVACSGWNSAVPDDVDSVNLDYIVAPFVIDDDEFCDSDEFCIYMFEDSYIETGVVNVFWQDEELRYMFNILEDYLYYLEVVDRETSIHIFGADTDKPLHELRKALLHLIDHPMENSIAEYANVIRRTRDTYLEKRLNLTHFMKCDFCGKPIKDDNSRTNYRFYHYSGKHSCLECAKTAVTAEGFPRVTTGKEKVVEWINDKYKTAPVGPSLCILEDAEFINKAVSPGEYFAVTDDFDSGTSGFTVLTDVPASVEVNVDEELMLRVVSGEAGDRYQEFSDDCEDWVRLGYFVENANIIAIENGLPQFRFEATMAHELSHQWQYENLSKALLYQEPYPGVVKDEFDQEVDMTDFRIEGHASWVQWKYLKTHGKGLEAAKLKRQMKNRNDEYGIGFRWFSELMRVGGTDKYSRIPRGFKFKLKRLWYQIKKNPFAMMALYFGGGFEASSEEATDDIAEPYDENNGFAAGEDSGGGYDDASVEDIEIPDIPMEDIP